MGDCDLSLISSEKDCYHGSAPGLSNCIIESTYRLNYLLVCVSNSLSSLILILQPCFGLEYFGGARNPLSSKLACLPWEKVKNPFFKPNRFPSLEENLCRNPGNFRNAPWCFTNEKISEKPQCRPGCLDSCNGKGGKCESYCGKNGYCCSAMDGNNGDCPVEALALAKTSKTAKNYHVCFAPKLKWKRKWLTVFN